MGWIMLLEFINRIELIEISKNFKLCMEFSKNF